MNLLNYVYYRKGKVVGSQVSYLDHDQMTIENIENDSNRFKSAYSTDEVDVFMYDSIKHGYYPVNIAKGVIDYIVGQKIEDQNVCSKLDTLICKLRSAGYQVLVDVSFIYTVVIRFSKKEPFDEAICNEVLMEVINGKIKLFNLDLNEETRPYGVKQYKSNEDLTVNEIEEILDEIEKEIMKG